MPGRLEWIGLRPLRREPVIAVPEATVIPGRGLAGDHYLPKRGGRREVTLLQFEHLAEVAATLGIPDVRPEQLRRNLVISGLRLTEFADQWIQIGEVVLSPTGPCVPCSRMQEALGPEGLRAMRGRGGLTAVITQGGVIRVGDPVSWIPPLVPPPVSNGSSPCPTAV